MNICLSKKKNLLALDPIQFINRSKKVSCQLVERNAPKIRARCFETRLWHRDSWSWIYAYEPESKQQSTVWVFEDEPNPTKVACTRSTAKQMIACFFFKKTGLVAIVALEQRRRDNHLFASCLPRNQENQPLITDHSSQRQCELSHIGSNNCIFEHSKHQFGESYAVYSWLGSKSLHFIPVRKK